MALHNQYQQKYIQQSTHRPSKRIMSKGKSVLYAIVLLIELLSVSNSFGLKRNEKNVKVVFGQ
ncbi:hypothetical protein AMD00_10130 [Viridibacillus arvi]|uniref:Uncharacterized protein n=1 Tax=Viridibacillus arvi TaxID=263475 RepID=A0A0M0LCG7_9BACL|nr:hypothetical protein AMD00_10130 [Viridibacillus arvi]